MNNPNPLSVLVAILMLGLQGTSIAGESPGAAEQPESQAQLEAQYKKALAQVEEQQRAAEVSIEKAREQLQLVNEQRDSATEDMKRKRAASEAELEKMQEELNNARRQLRESSREISRVNREVARARAAHQSNEFISRTWERPVIGVILGEANDVGVKVLGVSPDGPAERAGIEQGDVIVALDGRVLATVDEAGDTKSGLNMAMKEIKANEPLIISVERGDQTVDLTVVPEVREPLTWKTITRFPSVPAIPGKPHTVVMVEQIEVPEIDTEAIAEQIEKIRIEVDEQRAFIESGEAVPFESEYEFEFHELSELGDFALNDANVWFGLPMTHGLQLAEIDPGLGEYFKTDRGVLVLKARQDNDMQLRSGDVILQVGGTAVNSPAEFMRALRGYDAGDEFEMEIKRERKNRTLKTVMPENRTSYYLPAVDISRSFIINTTMN